MKTYLMLASLASAALIGLSAHAQTAPVSATCKDGTTYSGTHRSGACRGHDAVKLFADAAAKKVCVNAATKVYHRPTDPAYGKIKTGSYMSEADAHAAGNKPSGGKSCP